jgi:hypothetical protein
MAESFASRRAVLGAISFTPMIALSDVCPAAAADDEQLLAAWRDLQQAYRRITARGPFRTSESHSCFDVEAFDRAEETLVQTPARTIAGIEAKLWATWGTCSTSAHLPQLMDAIYRADFGAIESLAEKLDWSDKGIFSVLQAIRSSAGGRA